MKPIILIFLAYYIPGYKSGGPVRTIANMVDQLGDEFWFKIVIRDRDALDRSPFPDVDVDAWNSVGNADVFYASPEMLSLRGIRNLIRETHHDVVYLNGFFDPKFSVLPLMLRRLGATSRTTPYVIAPRGEFSQGALALKAKKKKLYIGAARVLGLYCDLQWHASSVYEAEHIRRVMGSKAQKLVVASDLPPVQGGDANHTGNLTEKDALKVIFLSRVTPKKNLEFALRALAH